MPVQFRIDPSDGIAHIDYSMSTTAQDLVDLAEAIVRAGGLDRLRGVVCDFRGTHVEFDADGLEQFDREVGPGPEARTRLHWACIHDPRQVGALEDFVALCRRRCCEVRMFTERSPAVRWLQDQHRLTRS